MASTSVNGCQGWRFWFSAEVELSSTNICSASSLNSFSAGIFAMASINKVILIGSQGADLPDHTFAQSPLPVRTVNEIDQEEWCDDF